MSHERYEAHKALSGFPLSLAGRHGDGAAILKACYSIVSCCLIGANSDTIRRLTAQRYTPVATMPPRRVLTVTRLRLRLITAAALQ
jgi:hypothetical protein